MLDTVVAIVLGNAVVATVLALGVVLLARWYHKPALLHGLWVVVLLKLVTPPMLTIPVPVELPPAMVSAPEDAAIPEPEPPSEPEPAASPRIAAIPRELGVNIEPAPTIVIEDVLASDGEWVLDEPRPEVPAGASIKMARVLEDGEVFEIESHLAGEPPAVESVGFPATVPMENPSAKVQPESGLEFSWRMLLWPALAVWGLGALVVFVQAFRQIWRFERSLSEALPAEEALQKRVEVLARRLGLAAPPEVSLLSGAISPMLWGFGRKPRMLLPRDLLRGLHDEAIDSLILHELAHMRRGDHWVRVLELVCQCIYWWHPVVWWGRKQLRIVEEECCDAFVVEHCPGGVYARALLATVDFLSQKKPVMPPAASGIGQLEFLKRRLTMIIEGGVSARLAGLPKYGLLTAAVVALSILPRVVAQTAADEAAETKAEAPTEEAAETSEGEPTPAPQPAAPILGQEPFEFAKTPRGYPVAKLEVRDLAFSPDGKRLAAGYGKWDTAGEVVIYDYATKQVIKKFPQNKGVASVAFSVDGKYLAASIWNNLLQIWDTETWELVADKTNGAHVARIAFSPDGKYLGWGNERGELRLITVGKWDEERVIEGELFRFQKVAFSPDSKLLAAVGGSFADPRFGRGLVIDVETGKTIAQFGSDGAVIASVAFSPDGKELATGEYGTSLRFWETTTGKSLAVVQVGSTMDTVEYTADGTLIGPSFNGEVSMIKNHAVVRTLVGHEGRSLTARMSPDGKALVSGGIDAFIRIWNPETGVPIGTMRPNESPEDTQQAVLAIAHSPDGKYVVTTHEDTSVRLREAGTGELLNVLKGHEDVVASAAFSPDSQRLATASYDHLIKLWNVGTAEPIHDLKGHTNWVFSVAFSPDGKILASGGYDKTARLWNAETGETIAVLEGHSAAVRSVAFSPQGDLLVTGSSDRTLRVWDLKTRKTIHELKGHSAAVRSVAFSPDGSKIASASEDKTARFWNPETGESIQELQGHTGMVWTLAFSPRGRSLATGGFDNTVRIWNAQTGTAIQTLTGHQDVVTSLSYAPDSRSLVTGSYDKSLKLWPAIDPPVPALADLRIGNSSIPVRFVEFTPDGTRMIVGHQDRVIQIWDLKTGRMSKLARQPRGIGYGALTPDGKLLATMDFGGKVYFWNAETLELLDTLETGQKEGIVMTFSPDGQWLATGDWGQDIKIWDLETREMIAQLPKQEMPVGGLAFSPDGTLLASATGNYKEHKKPGTVKLWSTKTWQEVANLPGPAQKMRQVKFSPDGKTLIAGGSQPELLVYDVPNKKLAAKISVGTEAASLAFLPGSRTVAIGGYDGSVGLWSLDTRGRVMRYEGHSSAGEKKPYIFEVAVSADGSVVASAAGDGRVKLWPTSVAPEVKPLSSLPIENAEAFSVAVSPDGSRFAIATTAKTVEIRETKTGNVLETISGLNRSCVSLSYSPDGKMIAGAMQNDRVHVWNADSGDELLSLDVPGARRAVFSPDGKMLATGGWDQTAAVWNLPDGSLRYRVPKQELALSDIKFSPEGKLLITATGSYKDWRKPGSMKIWKADDGTFFGELGSHQAEIKGILFDAGGKSLISYGGNGAKVWERINRKLLRTIGAGTTITAAALSPDGSTLYAGDRLGQMVAYDVETGKVKQSLEGHEALVYSVSASPDGTVLASTSKDGFVKLWPGGQVPGQRPLAQEMDDPQQSRTIAYSPDGKWLAVAGKKKTISLRESATLKEVGILSGHNGMVFHLVFAPDSQSLFSCSSDGTVRQWSIPTGEALAKWTVQKEKLANVRGLAVSRDGQRVAAGNENGETVVWDLETNQELYRLPIQPMPITDVALSPDGQTLATCTGSWQDWKKPGELKLWNARTGEPLATLAGHEGEIKGVLFNRDCSHLISYGSDQTVKVWNLTDDSLVRTFDFDRNISAAALVNDEWLLVGDTHGNLFVANFKEGGFRRQTRGHYTFLAEIAVSPSGTQFATVGHDGMFKTWATQPPEPARRFLPIPKAQGETPLAEKVRLWQPLVSRNRETLNLNRVKTLKPHGDKVWFAVYSLDGKILATGGEDQTVKLWNAETLELTAVLKGHKTFTAHAAFSPDGSRIATVGWEKDRSVKLWDTATGRLLASADPHGAGCRKVAFSPDGKTIATACEDGHLRLFSADLTLKLDRDLGLNLYSVAFSPDGKTLAAGTGNWKEKKLGRITLWDAETGQQLKELENSDGLVFQLQFLKDGRHLLAGNAGAGCAIWDLETGGIAEFYHNQQDTRWVEISRDEKQLVATYQMGQVQVFYRHQSEPAATFQASEKFLHCAVFSPDGKQLLIGAEDGTLAVWDMKESAATTVAESSEKAESSP